MADDVSVTLSSDEALVLFDVLHRWEDSGLYERADLQPGELPALWAIAGRLESLLAEPFKENYGDLADQARQRLKDLSGAIAPAPRHERSTAQRARTPEVRVHRRQDGDGGSLMRAVEDVVISVLLSGLAAVAALVATFPVQQDDSDPPSCASLLNLSTSCSESDSWTAVLVAAMVTFVLVMVIATWAGRRNSKAAHPA